MSIINRSFSPWGKTAVRSLQVMGPKSVGVAPKWRLTKLKNHSHTGRVTHGLQWERSASLHGRGAGFWVNTQLQDEMAQNNMQTSNQPLGIVVPQFTEINYPLWRYTVRKYAAQRGLTFCIEGASGSSPTRNLTPSIPGRLTSGNSEFLANTHSSQRSRALRKRLRRAASWCYICTHWITCTKS